MKKNLFTLIALCIVGFIIHANLQVLIPVMPHYAISLGTPVYQVGLVVGLTSYATAFFLIPSGMLADRVGRRNILVTGLFAFTVIPIFYLATANPTQLMVVRFLHGLALAITLPTVTSLVIDSMPQSRRGEAIGWVSTLNQAGLMAGPIVGGFILSYYGFDAAFYSCIAFALLGLSTIITRFHAIPLSCKQATSTGSSWGWLRNHHALGALFTLFFVPTGSGAIGAYLPLYGQGFGINPAKVGIIIGALFGSSALLRLPTGIVTDRIGKRVPLICGFAMTISAVTLISYSSSFGWLITATIIFGLGMAMTSIPSFSLIADIAPPRVRSQAMGIAHSSLWAGVATGATVMGIVAGMSNYEIMFRVCALSMITGLLTVSFLLRGLPSSNIPKKL